MSLEERMKILEMVASGQITADEGARLLDASGVKEAPQAAPEKVVEKKIEIFPGAEEDDVITTGKKPTRLRVKVESNNGKSRVNVNLPLTMMKFGLRMGGRFVDELKDVEDEIDLLMEAINNEVSGKIIEVDDENEHVEVFLE